MATVTVADELEYADELRQRGVISQAEFDAFKARLLGPSPTVSGSPAVEVSIRTVAAPPPPPTGASRQLPPPPRPPPPTGATEPPPPPAKPLSSRSPTARRSRGLTIAGIGVVVIGLVVTFVTVIGHGGGTLTLTGSPRQIVVAAATRTEAATTFHMKFTFSFSGTPSFAGQSGKPVSASISGEGAFDFAHKLATFTASATGQLGTGVDQARVIGSTVYLSHPGLSKADGGKPWIHIGLTQYEKMEGEVGPPLSPNGLLPQSVEQLRQHSTKITDLRPATIDGVATIHYRVAVTGAATGTTTANVPFDVWINGQRQLSQVRLQIPFFGVNMSDTVTLSDYGSAVSVTPPPANQTANGAGLLKSGQLAKILGVSSVSSSSSPTG